MNVRWFPYDQQNCTFIISSWTHDRATIDYWPTRDEVNLRNMARNEEWDVIDFKFLLFFFFYYFLQICSSRAVLQMLQSRASTRCHLSLSSTVFCTKTGLLRCNSSQIEKTVSGSLGERNGMSQKVRSLRWTADSHFSSKDNGLTPFVHGYPSLKKGERALWFSSMGEK